jgi:hypothetical protein
MRGKLMSELDTVQQGAHKMKNLTLLVHPTMIWVLKNLVQMLMDGLREISIEPDLMHELPPAFSGRAIILGANFFEYSALSVLRSDSIVLNVENSSSGFITEEYIRILRSFVVWDYDIMNAEDISRIISRPVIFLKMFYVEGLSRIIDIPEKTTDVLFFGILNSRR